MKKILCTSFFLFLYVAATCQTILTGVVVGIADGDTFTLLTPAKREVKVRLHGIDCPEKNQDFGSRAKQYTSNLIFKKTVRVQVKNKDRYGRTIALVVIPGGRILNEELLKAGMAWHYKKYDQSRKWTALENTARARRVGLWSLKNPVAPWAFRKNGFKPKSSSFKIVPASVPRNMSSEISSPCGAQTTSGQGCKRLVRGGGKCYQHL
ncbi:MAG TPA: thermonuclease family protein [Sphingobacteriaceae bacterium]